MYEYDDAELTSLAVDLPEDILKQKWAGNIDWALQLIEARLKQDLPALLRSRLRVERAILHRLTRQYVYTREQALAAMRELIPDFASEELNQLELEGMVDYLLVNGEKRYFMRYHRSLMKSHDDLRARAGWPGRRSAPLLDEAIREMKAKGQVSWRFRLRGTLGVRDEAFLPGEVYRLHMPAPREVDQVGQVEIRAPGSAFLSAPDHPQRTVHFEERLARNRLFEAEYAYTVTARYVSLSPGEAPYRPYPQAAPPTPMDLAERAPHIAFTPYLRALCEELTQGAADKLQAARAIYEFVTTRVNYAFVRNYFLIERLGEFAAINLKGDCGIQALLFIALCRIAGIPARWQSGLMAEPNDVGSHDWAQFYLEPYGWLFCDPSIGGAAWRAGASERWNFYFGNLDPFRFVAAGEFQAPFDPPKRKARLDPYDNQDGEAECESKGFWGHEMVNSWEMLFAEKL